MEDVPWTRRECIKSRPLAGKGQEGVRILLPDLWITTEHKHMEFWPAVRDFCKNSKGLYTSKQYNTLLSYTFWLQGLKDIEFLSQTAVTTLPF